MRAVFLFLILVVVIFFIVRSSSDHPPDFIANETALTWTQRALGTLLALTASFALLHRALKSESLERQLGFVLPLLAGLLLISVHWSLALALGALGIALIAKDWPSKTGGPPPGSTQEENGPKP